MATRSRVRETWTTKDGRKIYVDDLSDQHLLNIVKMLLDNAESIRWRYAFSLTDSFGALPHGDMAEMAFEHEIDHLATCSDDELLEIAIPQWRALKHEVIARREQLVPLCSSHPGDEPQCECVVHRPELWLDWEDDL